jgi:hypothetical protein
MFSDLWSPFGLSPVLSLFVLEVVDGRLGRFPDSAARLTVPQLNNGPHRPVLLTSIIVSLTFEAEFTKKQNS